MSTKALRKELFAAVAMLIVAAIALSGSTYAWFAANTTVTAEDMQVTVVSDTTFLLIKAGHAENAAEVQTAKKTIDQATTTNAAIKPVAITAGALVSPAGISTVEGANAWYYRYSLDPASSNTSVTAITELASFDSDVKGTGKYVLVNEFSLSVAQGSNEIINLKVSDCSITTTGGGAQAVKVIVATTEAAEEFSEGHTTGSTVLASSITSNDVKYVKIYIYWDGADSDVFTNNINNLKDTSVVVTFTGTAGPSA